MTLLLTVPAIAILAAAAASDVAWRRIPNGLVLALAGLGVARLALLGLAGPADAALWPVLADVAAACALLAAGAAAFHLNLMGGGDVKLLAAGALWLGTAALWPFLMLTALAGGVLAGAYLAAAAAAGRPLQSLPYGVAIAAGGIAATLGA